MFHNYYRCPDCSNTWDDFWDSACDDECGKCGARDISPIKSEKWPDGGLIKRRE